ncbi:Predicted protein [Lachnospiraceae bacterium XPB1003]|nr:Predicted protein [Lachnospiraceae bacterium XPB1003]
MKNAFENFMSILAEALLHLSESFGNMQGLSFLCVKILIIVTVVFIVGAIFLSVVRKGGHISSVLTVLFASCGVLLFLIAPYSGMLVVRPSGNPAEVINEFMTDICDQDYEGAHALCGDNAAFGTERIPSDDIEAVFLEKLKNGYSYQLIGNTFMDGLTAKQYIKVRYFYLPATEKDLKEMTLSILDAIVQDSQKKDVYDENNNYLPGITDEAYSQAVLQTVGNGKDYFYRTEMVEVELNFVDGVWKMQMNDALRKVLNGGVDSTEYFCSNVKSNALEDVTYIPKIYMIDEAALAGPVPNKDLFGETTDPMEVQAVVDSASELIGDHELRWNPDIERINNTKISYYCDETILAISWRQRIDGEYCNVSEVIIADPSQLRRKLAGDTFGYPVQQPATALAAESNAVFALNADYYKFRYNGICVYQRQLYRCEMKTVDTCYFDENGNMLFSRAGQFSSEDEVKKFIDDNNVLFSVSFGPILVDNGEICETKTYPLGNINENYSRSSFGQIDELHYLMVTINRTGGHEEGGRIANSAIIMHDFGCEKAYALDGGQTAEHIMDKHFVSHVDWSEERMVSDIIYFATAIPDSQE